jgi:RNA polymerase sigma-70 factor (ECF subfamily)
MDELTEQVAAGLQRGSPQAWSKLYRTYSERLWREVARLIGPNAADVPDVVQEVFLAAAKSARQFDPARGSLWAWLMGIARREVALRYRKQASRLENARRWWGTLDGSAKHWVAGSGDAPLDVLESRELGSLVRATLLELSDDYQMLLTRKYLDGASGEEIARETDGTSEGVRAKLMRARRAFRKVFLKLARHDLDGSRS